MANSPRSDEELQLEREALKRELLAWRAVRDEEDQASQAWSAKRKELARKEQEAEIEAEITRHATHNTDSVDYARAVKEIVLEAFLNTIRALPSQA